MTWPQLEYSLQQRLLSGQVEVGQKSVHGLKVHLPSHLSVCKQRLDLRTKGKRRVGLAIVERLDSYSIPSQEQRPLVRIPNREGKHSAEMLEALNTMFLVQVDDYLCISSGSKGMASLEQALTQFREVVDLAVKDNPHASILIAHRLRPAAAQIDNRKAPVSETHASTNILAFTVRSAMCDNVYHPLDELRIDGPLTVEIDLSQQYRTSESLTCERAGHDR